MDLRGNEMKFKALYKKYYAPFCLYARHFIDNATICEDIVSDVFANMWSRIEELDLDRDTTPAYIKMCVRNSCLNHIKHSSYTKEFEQQSHFAELIYVDNPDKFYSIDELYKMLFETIELLPESHKDVFLKTYVDGKTREEIAEEMNISVKTVGRYKQKTIELLRDRLKEFLPIILLLLS